MAATVVDTSVLLGLVDSDDPQHDTATRIVRGIDRGDLPTGRITNYVTLETLNWIHNRQHHQTAVETYDRLKKSAGFELLHAAQKDFARAIELFETYEPLAFGDATIVAYMEREDVEYLYSFDRDFDGIDAVSRLDTPVNPFEA